MSDFLFELGCEELPSQAVVSLAPALASAVAAALNKAQIPYETMKPFATPRRLALLIFNLHEEQPPQKICRRGPALSAAYDNNGQPSNALLGFARSCGVNIDALTQIKTEKGEWIVYKSTTQGTKTATLLPSIIKQALQNLPINKLMRWGNADIEFARPVHWATMLFDNEILKETILTAPTNNITYGHRFHAPQSLCITTPKDYETLLYDAHVIADFAKRRSLIEEQVKNKAASYGAEAIMPDWLIDEVTSIVEWPEILVAHFNPTFLDIPREALIAAMQNHQKCFALCDQTGVLIPYFITVSNLKSINPSQVIAGNESVMHARLSDAAFFFHQDKKVPLSDHISSTKNVVFEARLGSLWDKSQRLQKLIATLISPLHLDTAAARRASELCKCDLLTGMVGEFPELQGIMGYYYALLSGEAPDVAEALRDYYLPRFAGDDLPPTPLSTALSLVDRIDTLVGIFAIGQKPTGEKDPFKLRRHALAVVRLLIMTPEPLNLMELLKASALTYQPNLMISDGCLKELHSFILERLHAYYLTQNITPEMIAAVLSRQENWLYDFDKRVKALAAFITLPEAISLTKACKRVNNLLHEEKMEIQSLNTVEQAALQENAEKMLYTQLITIENQISPLLKIGEYVTALKQLAHLKESVDVFFENVMVMVDDAFLRANRLALLARLQHLLQGIADISLL